MLVVRLGGGGGVDIVWVYVLSSEDGTQVAPFKTVVENIGKPSSLSFE